MTYPLNKFVLEHSEDYDGGKTLIMNIGPSGGETFTINVILWEVQDEESFIIIDSKDRRNPHKGSLTMKEKRLAFTILFEKGVDDQR